jgi:hypothetical protein
MNGVETVVIVCGATAGFVVGVFFTVVWWVGEIDRYVAEQIRNGTWAWDDY